MDAILRMPGVGCAFIRSPTAIQTIRIMGRKLLNFIALFLVLTHVSSWIHVELSFVTDFFQPPHPQSHKPHRICRIFLDRQSSRKPASITFCQQPNYTGREAPLNS
jgi:hypothetical protein